MICIQGTSSSLIIVLHEIYGINEHMRTVCKRFAGEGFDVICPNLLPEKQTYAYSNEATAHQNFMQNVGFGVAQYQVESLSRQMRSEYERLFVVGFSVGATIAWLCSQNAGLYDGVVGFYGSRIRDYMNLAPACPVLLFFPQREDSFDVDEKIRELADKPNVDILKFNALHGFADPWSDKYCRKASEAAMTRTLLFLQQNLGGIETDNQAV